MRILIVRFSSLGDMVLLASLVEAVHRTHPGAELWLATKREWAPLYSRDPRVHRIVELGQGGLGAVVRALEPVAFDLALDAHGSLRSRLLLSRLRPVPTRRIAKDTLARLAFLHFRRRSARLDRSLVERYTELVDLAAAPRPRIALAEEDRAAAAGMQGRWLAIAPGAKHPTKRWPVESFAAAAKPLVEQRAAQVLVLAGPGEEAEGEALASQLPGSTLLAGAQPLRELAARLERCELLLGNDSGLSHLAEAMGTPVVTIFGPTVREWGYAPLDAASAVVEQAGLPCRPCSRSGEKPCRMPERWCLLHSRPAQVAQLLEERWDAPSPTP